MKNFLKLSLICFITMLSLLSCNSNSNDGIYENHFGMPLFEPYDSKILFFTFDKASISSWDWAFDYYDNCESESYPIPCTFHKKHSNYIIPNTDDSFGSRDFFDRSSKYFFFDRSGKIAYYKWGVDVIAFYKTKNQMHEIVTAPDGYIKTAELVQDFNNNLFNIKDDDSKTIGWVEYFLGLRNLHDEQINIKKEKESDSWNKAKNYISQLMKYHEENGWNNYFYKAERINETDIRFIYVDKNGDYTLSVIQECKQNDKFICYWKYSLLNEGRDIHIGLNGNYGELLNEVAKEPESLPLIKPVNPNKPSWTDITAYQFKQAFKEDLNVIEEVIIKALQPTLDSAFADFGKKYLESNSNSITGLDKTRLDDIVGSNYYMDICCIIVVDEGKIVKAEPIYGSHDVNYYFEPANDTMKIGPEDIPYYDAIAPQIKKLQFPTLHPKERGKIHVFSLHTIIKSTLTPDLLEIYTNSKGKDTQ